MNRNRIYIGKKLVFLLIQLAFCCSLCAQNNLLRGVVLFQNSGKMPVSGVRISGLGSANGANSIYTTDKGEFLLSFSSKSEGDRVRLSVGKQDQNGQSIELVNEKEIENCRIPSSPLDTFLIIVCHAGQRDLAMQRYYNILETAAKKKLKQKERKIDRLLEQQDLDEKTIADLVHQKEKLKQDFLSVQDELEEQALFIANINLDNANKLVKEAVQMIDQQQDIEKALEILSLEKLMTMHAQNQETINKSEENIRTSRISEKKLVEALKLRIKLLQQNFQYADIIACYESIVLIYKENSFEDEALAEYQLEIGTYYAYIGQHEKSNDFLSTFVKELESKESSGNIRSRALAQIGINYMAMGDVAKSGEFMERSSASYVKADKSTGISEKQKKVNALKKEADSLFYTADKRLEALTLRRQIVELMPNSTYYAKGLIKNLHALGKVKEALPYEVRELEKTESRLGENHPSLGNPYEDIAISYMKIGNYKEAQKFLSKALTIARTSKNINLEADVIHSKAYSNYIQAKRISNKERMNEIKQFYNKGIELYKESLAIYRNIGPNHSSILEVQNMIGLSYLNLGDQQSAIAIYDKVVEKLEQELNDYPLSYSHFLSRERVKKSILYYNNSIRAYKVAKDYNNAIRYRRKVIEIQESFFASDNIDLAYSYNDLGFCQYFLKDYSSAISSYLKSKEVNPAVESTVFHNNIGLAYCKIGKLNKAETAFKEFEKLNPKNNRAFRNWTLYYSLLNEEELSILNLQKAIDLGFDDLAWIKNEEGLENLKRNRNYQRIVKELEAK